MAENDLFKDMPQISDVAATKLLSGWNSHQPVNMTAVADTDAAYFDVEALVPNSRGIAAFAQSGIVKFEYHDDGVGAYKTAVVYLNRGAFLQWRRISKIYKHYKASTTITTKSYTDAGADVVGVTILR